MEKSIRHVIGETGVAGVVAFCRRGVWCVIAGCFLAFFLFSPSPGFSQQGAPQEISTLASAQQDELLRLLREGDREEKRKALYDLLGMGKSAAPVLIEALEIPDPAIQSRAIYYLWEMDVKEAVPRILPLLDSEDDYIQQVAALGLGHLGVKSAAVSLREKLETTQHGGVICACLTALGLVGDGNAKPILGRFLKSDVPMYQLYAAGALGMLHDNRGLDIAVKHSKSDKVDLQWASIMALGEIDDKSAREVLSGIFKDQKGKNREITHVSLRKHELRSLSPEEKVAILQKDVVKGGYHGQWAAIQLRKVGTKEAVAVLKGSVKDEKGKTRWYVAMNLAFMGQLDGGKEDVPPK